MGFYHIPWVCFNPFLHRIFNLELMLWKLKTVFLKSELTYSLLTQHFLFLNLKISTSAKLFYLFSPWQIFNTLNSLLIHFFTLFMEHLACGEAILEAGHKLGILSRYFSSLRLEHFVKTIRLSPNNIPGIVIDIRSIQKHILVTRREFFLYIWEDAGGK